MTIDKRLFGSCLQSFILYVFFVAHFIKITVLHLVYINVFLPLVYIFLFFYFSCRDGN